MARAIFCVPLDANGPVLPPMVAESGLQLGEYDAPGHVRDGCGFSVIGHVPYSPTCLVLVDSSQAVLDEMAGEVETYAWIEDVVETGVI